MITRSDSILVSPSTFPLHIFQINFGSTRKKMHRVYARWVVACMKHIESIWNGAIMNFIHNTVNSKVFFIYSTFSVPMSISAASPNPASIRFMNFAQKFVHNSIFNTGGLA